MKYMLLCGLAASVLSAAAVVPAWAEGDDGQFTGGPFGWSYSVGPQMSPQFTGQALQSDQAPINPRRSALAGTKGDREEALVFPGFRPALHALR